MSTINFTKMQGTGNDFVVIDCVNQTVEAREELAASICERRFGAGADQMILVCPSEAADFKMEIYNPDGSQVEMCGNALRAVAVYLNEKGLSEKSENQIETLGGLVVTKFVDGQITIDMGEPSLTAESIGLTMGEKYIGESYQFSEELNFDITTVSMGNPHCVIFVEETETFPLETVGPIIENHALFANRTNVEFIQIIDRETIKMRVWERGTGETLACGSGACASVVASILNDYAGRALTVKLRGGDLNITWDEADNHVYMSGPAVTVYEGVWTVNR